MNIKNEKPKQRKRVQIVFTEPSLTKQEFAEENDINFIVKRAQVTGELPLNMKAPVYGDFSEVPDYQSALNIVNEAQEAFQSLSSAIRERFSNNPAMMLDFLADPRNIKEAVELGLIAPPTVTVPIPGAKNTPNQSKTETPEKNSQLAPSAVNS